MEFSNTIPTLSASSRLIEHAPMKSHMEDLPGASYFGENISYGESALSGSGDPSWKKNHSNIYVVAYPSDTKSMYFMTDATIPINRSLGAGYGIFVEPKKVSKAKFWKEKQPLPVLFTVEGGGPAPGLTRRHGLQWGINGMLVRFLIDSKNSIDKIEEVNASLQNAARSAKSGDETWLREALIALAEAGLIKSFHIATFLDLARSVVQEQLQHGANWMKVLTIHYEDHINKEAPV